MEIYNITDVKNKFVKILNISENQSNVGVYPMSGLIRVEVSNKIGESLSSKPYKFIKDEEGYHYTLNSEEVKEIMGNK